MEMPIVTLKGHYSSVVDKIPEPVVMDAYPTNNENLPLAKDRFVQDRIPQVIMTWNEWYDNLAKPSWASSPSTISLIWMIIYPVILVGFGFGFLKGVQGKFP